MSDVQVWSVDAQASQVYHLRMGGLSFEEIAEHFMMTVDQAISAYRERVTTAAMVFGEDKRELITQLELDRLDALQAPHWAAAASGDIKAGEFILKVMQQRAKYLQLDQVSASTPESVARVLIVGGNQAEFIEALQSGRNQHLAGGTPEDGGDPQEGK